MGPPTEQLIRDYLNRLSVAARGQLGPDERRVLVERTRQLIEHKADLAGRPTTLEVGRVLASLGGPAGLIEQEVQRLAAGGEPAAPPSEEPAEVGFLARVLRREPGWIRGASWRWPADTDGEAAADAAVLAEDEPRLPETPGAGGGRIGMPTLDSATVGTVLSGTVLDGAGLDGSPDRAAPVESAATGLAPDGTGTPGSELVRPRWPQAVARDGRRGNGTKPRARADPSAAHADLPREGGAGSNGTATNGAGHATSGHGTARAGGPAADTAGAAGKAAGDSVGVGPAWQLETPGTSALGSAVRRLLAAGVDWPRRRPLETAAVVVLGLGGAIYPPVFLLGAAVALASRRWDYRDKWIGLAVPVVVTLIGLAVGIAMGGRTNGLHDGWLWLNIMSRIAAALGAGYLAWRVAHGRRPPAVPPWHKPHRLH